MPTQSFVKAKAEGRKFEKQVFNILEESGCYVIDTDKLPYNQKKGCDCFIKLLNPDGSFKLDQRGYVICQPVEIKYDKMSYDTNSVYIEQEALDKSISSFWLYGLPESDYTVIYSVLLSDLRKHSQRLGTRVYGGEFRSTGYLIPKPIFTSQPWVTKWKSITTN
jgi:hypothetical protein